ncbi:MAG: protein kinase, partial [Myxococcota bacterium]
MNAPGGAERFGPFVFLKRLGSGGMGTAHLATHPGTEGLLVVKRMHPGMVRDPVLFKRFVHEAEVVSHVQHPNVAALVAMGTVDGEPFLATEYVFGLQASQIIERVQNTAVDLLPLHVALQISVELTAGLAAIHGARHRDTGTPLGLLHRDVGARNVLVGFDGRVRLIDLGLGKSILADWHTATDVLAGSPDYMPPEQALGAVVDVRADVYAAAVTVWELLAGTKRIQEGTVAARVRRAIEAQPESLSDRRSDVPRTLENLLQRAMAADPDHRLGSAAELSKGLAVELKRLRRGRREEPVRGWLDSACATIIARERRALQQLRAMVPELASNDAHLELMVGAVQGWVPQSGVAYLPSHRSRSAGDAMKMDRKLLPAIA